MEVSRAGRRKNGFKWVKLRVSLGQIPVLRLSVSLPRTKPGALWLKEPVSTTIVLSTYQLDIGTFKRDS
jgi:hypothetical protein